jgi:phosphoglycolate phosphatase-like HAD superfamily hydrolase
LAILRKPLPLVLFDMDGTLVNVMKAHQAGIEQTAWQIWGVDEFPMNVDRQGKPQLQSLWEACVARNIPEEMIVKQMPDAARLLSKITIGLLPLDLRPAILPGVIPLLDYLTRAAVSLVLVTGTLQKTVEIILERSGLEPYFKFFVSGETGRVRQDLVKHAVQRAEIEFSRKFPRNEIVAIGDSPNDILTARSLGIKIVSVATGLCSLDELSKHQPDIVLPHLFDLNASIRAITGDDPLLHLVAEIQRQSYE